MKNAETVTQQGTASTPSEAMVLPGRRSDIRHRSSSHRKWIWIFLALVRSEGSVRRMMMAEQSVRAAKRPI